MFFVQSLRWRIALTYTVLSVAIVAGLTVFLTRQVRTVVLSSLQEGLVANTRLLAENYALRTGLEQDTWPAEMPPMDELVANWAALLDTRITVIAPNGTVLTDSIANADAMENHANRPEVVAALRVGQGESSRSSRTTGYETFYVAVPILPMATTQTSGGSQVSLGVIRLALPISQIQENVAPLRNAVVAGGVVVILLTVLLSVVVAERIARPVRRLTEVATLMSRGNWDERLYPTTRDEVGRLVRSFNRMADRLQAQMGILSREQQRLSTVLDNMVDGVLLLDGEGWVPLINPAAARILQIERKRAQDLSFPQVVRDHRLVELWQRSRDTAVQEETMLDLDPYVVRAVSTPYWDGQTRGYAVILQDLTQLKRLETVRQDFVSNISHELRTPLASLRALVETLRDGALDDPPAAVHFLDRIETEVDALAQMVQELLELSRIESGQVPLRLRSTPVSEIVLPPLERLQPLSERSGVDFVVDLPGRLPPVQADPERMHQVMTNLLHNAIKFTPVGGTITVRAELSRRVANQTHVIVSVHDTGAGIPWDDLPRIFERFFKTDRARSAGGTGLGLAISKHIVQAHNGRIWAESREGMGSTFFFTLPVVDE